MGGILRRIIIFFHTLLRGMKSTEVETLTQIGKNVEEGTSIERGVHMNSLSHALMNGEATEEVQELRYRNYIVDREAKRYEYFSPTLAKKRDKTDSKFIEYENADSLEIITIQNNIANGIDMDAEMAEILGEDYEKLEKSRVENEETLKVLSKTDENIVGKVKDYTINIRRSFIPRFRLEIFTRRLVVRRAKEDNRAILDFYVSKYVDEDDVCSKPFIGEVERLKNASFKTDIVEFSSVDFITSHAWGKEDMLSYEFNNITYLTTIEYDGNYILRFSGEIVKDGVDGIEKYYNSIVDRRYKNKEKKETTLILTPDCVEYICEGCGKRARLIPSATEEGASGAQDTLDFYDMQISHATYGKTLCKDCLRKYLEFEALK